MDGHLFDEQLGALPSDVGIVCWDARGHGRSALDIPFSYRAMLDDLHAIVREVGASDLTLIGQSMGGNLAQSYADAHPGAVNRLVIIDSTANHGPLRRVDSLALRATGAILRAYPWDAAVRESARACGVRPETQEYAERCLRRMGKRRFIEVMGFWRDALGPDTAYRFAVPVLALVGDHDESGNIRQAMRRLADTDPAVTLITVTDAGHNSNQDNPVQTNRAILDFLVRC